MSVKGQHNYIVMDFETGGLEANIHAITEVALIVVDGFSLKELERYESHISPYDKEYTKEALQYTGKTMELLENNGKQITDVATAISNICKKHVEGRGRWKRYPILVGHNFAKFDLPFFKELMKVVNIDSSTLVEPFVEDTLMLARRAWMGVLDKFDLTTCCYHIGHQLTNAHNAMPDVEGNLVLFKHLTDLSRNTLTKNQVEENKSRELFKF